MTFSTVETFPPAKLNLFLELIAKRPDGYHDIQTLMTAIDRCDRLRVSKVPESTLTLNCRWGKSVVGPLRNLVRVGKLSHEDYEQLTELPPITSNLVYRALERFRDVFSIEAGFHVELTKRIPAGAGMGGASSDAASALLCAAALTGVPSDDVRIREIAASLGSDIPFFLGEPFYGNPSKLSEELSNQKCGDSSSAVATGRGDQLEFIKNSSRTHWVVVYPPQGLSTADVYRHCTVSTTKAGIDQCLAFLRNDPGCRQQKLMATIFFNRLLEPARQLSDWVDQTLTAIQQSGLGNSSMTGSGSACFAFARSASVARHAVNRLLSRRAGIVFHATSTQLPASIRMVT